MNIYEHIKSIINANCPEMIQVDLNLLHSFNRMHRAYNERMFFFSGSRDGVEKLHHKLLHFYSKYMITNFKFNVGIDSKVYFSVMVPML